MNIETLVCLSAIAGGLAAQEPRPTATTMTIELEVDCALARDRVWLLADSSDAQVVETAAKVVRKRCAAMTVAAQVSFDPERRQIEIALPGVANPRQRELAESLLRSIGLCEFSFVADAQSAKTAGIDLKHERFKLEAWKKVHPGAPLELFNTLDIGKEGPHPRISWISLDPDTPGAESRLGWPILLPGKLDEHFGAASFERTSLAEDSRGKPAIAFELRASRQVDFQRTIKEHAGERLAIIVEGKLAYAPKVDEKLATGGLIEGQFTPEEARRLLAALQELQSPLRITEIR